MLRYTRGRTRPPALQVDQAMVPRGDAWMSLSNTEQVDERVFQFLPFLRVTKTTPP